MSAPRGLTAQGTRGPAHPMALHPYLPGAWMLGAMLRLKGESAQPQRPSGCPQSSPRRPSTGPGSSENRGLRDSFYAGIRVFTRNLEGQRQLTWSEWPRQGTAEARAEFLEELEVWRTLGSLACLAAVGSGCVCQNGPGYLLKRFRVALPFSPELHIQVPSGLSCQLRAVTPTVLRAPGSQDLPVL